MGWFIDKLRSEDSRLFWWQSAPRTQQLPQPSAPEQPETAGDYLDRARHSMQMVRPVTVDERYAGNLEYRTWDGQTFSIPQRTAGDIVNVPTSKKTWEPNSWGVKTDVGALGDATPQKRHAAYQMANRDGRFTEVNIGQVYRDAAAVTADLKSGKYNLTNAPQMPTRSAPNKNPGPGW